MLIEQRVWRQETNWHTVGGRELEGADLVLVFGARERLQQAELRRDIEARYPGALIAGCSTAGEIQDINVLDRSVVATAIRFEKTSVRSATTSIDADGDARRAGRELLESLPREELAHILVLSEGLQVNGSQLVQGMKEVLPEGVSLTGGLSGDGPDFNETVLYVDGEVGSNRITAIGFYGSAIRIGHGSSGGWDPFGPDRLITRSEGNELYELDGESALALYKNYLGEHAEELPSSGLRFPLLLREDEQDIGVVRTILGIDEERGCMIFAGDMPEGYYARLMKANYDRLIDGAEAAARAARSSLGEQETGLAVLISCIGRKLVLRQRVEEEVEAVRQVLGEQAALAGFYSYGEISPHRDRSSCELHNQTMTITSFREN